MASIGGQTCVLPKFSDGREECCELLPLKFLATCRNNRPFLVLPAKTTVWHRSHWVKTSSTFGAPGCRCHPKRPASRFDFGNDANSST